MIFAGWAILGVVIGAAGSEVLRAAKPEMVTKVEDAAKRVADALWGPESESEESTTGADGDDAQGE